MSGLIGREDVLIVIVMVGPEDIVLGDGTLLEETTFKCWTYTLEIGLSQLFHM